MIDVSLFKEYLIYDDMGNLLGLRKDAPMDAKIAYRTWYNDQQDKERLAELFNTKA